MISFDLTIFMDEAHMKKSLKVLITGGAGYIGSHMVLKLLEAGHQPVIVDALLNNMKSLAPENIIIHQFNLNEKEKLDQLLKSEKIDVVMHFAAFIEVGESVFHPDKYYKNNFVNTLTLLETMQKNNIKHFIFSSTAAIFGEPQYLPVDEKHPKNPMSPYGSAKLMCENILKDFDTAYGLKSVCLRYFNAAGADPLLRTGYHLERSSHLIPRVLQAAEKKEIIEVYGRDFDTIDGTGVRDYIHVMDLCDAHLLAMQYLIQGGDSKVYNLGNGRGFSVQQVIDAAKKITQQEIKIKNTARREGDPAILYADSTLIQKELNWKPQYPELDTILKHSWAWEKKNNN